MDKETGNLQISGMRHRAAQRRLLPADATEVAMRIGAGALGEVIETADVLRAGIAKALLGKAAVPDELPFVTGSIGLSARSRATA